MPLHLSIVSKAGPDFGYLYIYVIPIYLSYLLKFILQLICVSDAELLLLSQPFSRVLSSKKVQTTVLLKFLISKGLIPTTDMTKSDLCLAFKSLVENQPDYIRPPVQPIQMSVPNNMLAITQNNNMMHTQPYQAATQQVCVAFNYTFFFNQVFLYY